VTEFFLKEAWIAGPVVGSAAGLVLIFASGLFLVRRRRRRKSAAADSTFEKAQLHGQSIARKPVVEKGSNNIYEMMGSVPGAEEAVEKPANEPPAWELDTNKREDDRREIDG
jgi:hypothetical protein